MPETDPIQKRKTPMATSTPVIKREPMMQTRTAIVTSADLSFRQRVKETLTGLHWKVREAAGGAEAMAHLDSAPAEAMILDSWLPDLEIQEFIAEFEKLYPSVDLVTVDDSSSGRSTAHSPRRNEVLYALRRGQDADGAAWNSAPVVERRSMPALPARHEPPPAYSLSVNGGKPATRAT